VEKLPLPDIRPLLLALLAHPSNKVAEAAAKALTSRGEKTEAPPAKPPLRFRLTANDEPIAGQYIEYKFDHVGSAAKTNDDGILEIGRDMALNAEQYPASIQLANYKFTSERYNLADTFFHTSVPMPDIADETIVDMPLQTRSVTLNFIFPQPAMEGTEMFIAADSHSAFYDEQRSIKLPATRQVTFPRVLGTLNLAIVAPGTADWRGEVDGDTANIELQPAHDVCFRLKFPKEIPQIPQIQQVYLKIEPQPKPQEEVWRQWRT